jgi:hypothetical protein
VGRSGVGSAADRIPAFDVADSNQRTRSWRAAGDVLVSDLPWHGQQINVTDGVRTVERRMHEINGRRRWWQLDLSAGLMETKYATKALANR